MSEEDYKICSDCNLELPLCSFLYLKAKANYMKRCRKCYANKRKPAVEKYVKNNKQKIREWHKKNYKINVVAIKEWQKQHYNQTRDKQIEYRREWYKKQDKENEIKKRREWYLNNKDKHAIKRAKYESNNKDRLMAARRKWENERLASDVSYRLHKKISGRIRGELNGNLKKRRPTEDLLGCTIEYFREFIESQFKDGMTWDNWRINGWHIDHRIPVSWFNLENENCIKIAFHYSNMQPLWSSDNLRKKNFYADKLYNQLQTF